ncbi:MAG: TRAP transporter TatT component family protein [Pseudomonadota bacterium]
MFRGRNRPPRTVLCALALTAGLAVTGCATVVSNATGGLADNLGKAILNQDDPETVRDGAPAFLLMLDSFVETSPQDTGMLGAAAELYAAYGVLFVDEPERATRLTARAQSYGQRALCTSNREACGIETLKFRDYGDALERLKKDDVPALYTYSLAWFASIRATGDMNALSQLPRAEAALRRVRALDPSYKAAEVSHYLGVLATIRPPALGGRFDEGRSEFERAIDLTEGRALSVQVDFARYYARTLYERELHDQLLKEVLAADPVAPELTLFNVMAQREAQELLASADDYF